MAASGQVISHPISFHNTIPTIPYAAVFSKSLDTEGVKKINTSVIYLHETTMNFDQTLSRIVELGSHTKLHRFRYKTRMQIWHMLRRKQNRGRSLDSAPLVCSSAGRKPPTLRARRGAFGAQTCVAENHSFHTGVALECCAQASNINVAKTLSAVWTSHAVLVNETIIPFTNRVDHSILAMRSYSSQIYCMKTVLFSAVKNDFLYW